MIWNIVDNRKRKYRWLEINAVIEDTRHDNSCKDSDQLEQNNINVVMYEQRKDTSLHDAVLWAEQATGKVTLYLYDKGDGFE